MTAVKREAEVPSNDLTKSSENVVAASEFQSERENYRFLYGKMKMFEEIETDQESSGSSEDADSSPRSVVAKVRNWPAKRLSPVRVHSQVLRIREEDSHLGDDIVGEYCLISTAKDHKVAGHHHNVAIMILSKPALPASPLSGKAAIKLVH